MAHKYRYYSNTYTAIQQFIFIGKYQLFVTNLKTNYYSTKRYSHKIIAKCHILSDFLRYIYCILMQFKYIFYFYKIILLDTHKLLEMLTS